jgi:hypothetical protein
VEFVSVGAQKAPSYRRFEGANLEETHPASSAIAERTAYVAGLKPASLP